MTHEELMKLAEYSIKCSEELLANIQATRWELNLMSVYGRRIERLEPVDFVRN